MREYDIYCPKCGSENINVLSMPERDRVSIDDLPVKQTKRSKTKIVQAKCMECGYSKEWTEKVEETTFHPDSPFTPSKNPTIPYRSLVASSSSHEMNATI